jgi:hypothetical protein
VTTDGSSWADPSSPTEPQPYAGPPLTSPAPGYGPPPYGSPPYGVGPHGVGPHGVGPHGVGPYGGGPYGGGPYGGGPYGAAPYAGSHPGPYGGYGWAPGQPPYPPPWGPPGPRRPGQVVASAVLALVQAGVVSLASAYVLFLASVAGLAAGQDPTGTVQGVGGLATEGIVLAVVQILSAVLLVVAGILALNRRTRAAWLALVTAHGGQLLLALYWAVRLVALLSDIPGPDPGGAFASVALVFAAGPAVGLGLVLLGPGARWFRPDAGPAAAPA